MATSGPGPTPTRTASRPPAPREPRLLSPPAQERLRFAYGKIVWSAILLSTALHFLLFTLWPATSVVERASAGGVLEVAELPPRVEIPPPPEALPRPALPVVADELDLDESVTMAPTRWDRSPVPALPPPRDDPVTSVSAGPTFVPHTVKPDVKNRDQVRRALLREYPPLLLDAGIGGTVRVWFFIDETGRVQDVRVHRSSGFPGLDRAALRVARVFRFSPALNRETPVAVWLALPIVFATR